MKWETHFAAKLEEALLDFNECLCLKKVMILPCYFLKNEIISLCHFLDICHLGLKVNKTKSLGKHNFWVMFTLRTKLEANA